MCCKKICLSFLVIVSVFSFFTFCEETSTKEVLSFYEGISKTIEERNRKSNFFNPFASTSSNYTTVQTSLGTVTGSIENGYRLFQGIPYAKPPVNDSRWAPPVPVSPWGNLQATEFPSSCPQILPPTNTTPFIETPLSEDCLYLNIWSPISSPMGKQVPVMVWFHGGAFVAGWGGDGLFWGDFITNTTSDTIVVTVNYRLGALGFLVTPELQGNFGFLDQQLALQWVQDHISSFGGDPSKVTIFGQSAGAMSVTLHTVSPSSAGLFSRALCESNPAGFNYRTPEESYPYSEKIAKLVGCNYEDSACLRKVPWEDFVNVQNRAYIIQIPVNSSQILPYSPVIDGTIIPEQPLEIFRRGAVHSNIEAMAFGTARNETLLIFPVDIYIPEFLYSSLVEAVFVDNSTTIEKQYPASRLHSNMNQFSILTTDWLFVCPSRFAALAFANSNIPTYLYQFQHAPSNDPINRNHPCLGAVCHSAELPFVRNSIDFISPGSFTSDEESLSKSMVNYWRDFAHGRLSENPSWPTFNSTSLESLYLDIPISTFSGYHAENCAMWDSFGYYN